MLFLMNIYKYDNADEEMWISNYFKTSGEFGAA